MKKPLLKVYITAPYYNPFDVAFVSKEQKIIDINNKEYKTNVFYKYIYDSVQDIIINININFPNYKKIYYFNDVKVKNILWMGN